MIKLTWLGHATWLIENGGSTLLVDPFLDDSPTAAVKAAGVRAQFILLTHGHVDHMADAVSIARRCGSTVIANFEICQWLASQGVKATEPMNLGGRIRTSFGSVKMTVAHHSSTLPDGEAAGNPAGFVVEFAGERVCRIYIAGDTALFGDMALIGRDGLDLAILPIGDRYTMGPDDAVEATLLLAPKRVAPSHYNTWPPIVQDAAAWAESIRRHTVAEPIVPTPGQSFVID